MDKTLVKGLQLLEALGQSSEPSGVRATAEQLGITKSNAHRLLQTLVAHGYAVNLDGRYALTLKVWEIGARVMNRLAVKEVAAEYLQQLSELSGETVHLSVLDGTEVVYIDKVESLHPIRAYSMVGGRAPAYAVATGKAMIAFAPEALIERIASTLTPFTVTTLAAPEPLRKELARVRTQGYAVNRGEWRDGVWGIAAGYRGDRHFGTGRALQAEERQTVLGMGMRFCREDFSAAGLPAARRQLIPCRMKSLALRWWNDSMQEM